MILALLMLSEEGGKEYNDIGNSNHHYLCFLQDIRIQINSAGHLCRLNCATHSSSSTYYPTGTTQYSFVHHILENLQLAAIRIQDQAVWRNGVRTSGLHHPTMTNYNSTTHNNYHRGADFPNEWWKDPWHSTLLRQQNPQQNGGRKRGEVTCTGLTKQQEQMYATE